MIKNGVNFMKLKKEILLVFILLFLTNGSIVIAQSSESAFSEDLTWKAVIVSGYASENGNVLLNWDRSRRKFHQEILRRGI